MNTSLIQLNQLNKVSPSINALKLTQITLFFYTFYSHIVF